MARRKQRGSRKEARQRAAFRLFATLLLLFTLFGLTRVSLAARIAQAAVDADRLRTDIRTERLVTDDLEVDRGVLSRPDRVAAIASASMAMSEPSDLEYLELPGEDAGVASPDLVSLVDIGGDEGFSVRSMISAVMDMAAGEAEALLIGDVGLGSAR